MSTELADYRVLVAPPGGISSYPEVVVGQILRLSVSQALYERDLGYIELVGTVPPSPTPPAVSLDDVLHALRGTASWSFTVGQLRQFILGNALDALTAVVTACRAALLAHTQSADNPHQVSKGQVGLGSVANLAPADLPVSKATQQALDLKATPGDVATAVAGKAASGVNKDITSLEGTAEAPGIKFKVGLTTLASAATVDIGNAPTRRVRITGTGTITSLGPATNAEVLLSFTEAATLTYNPMSLVLPGYANIVTAPGDTAWAISNEAANWRLIDYRSATGKPLYGLGKQDANAVAITGGAINGTPIGATAPSTVNATTYSLGGIPFAQASSEFRFLNYSSGNQMLAFADQYGAQAYYSCDIVVFRSANLTTTFVTIAPTRVTFNAAIKPGQFTVATAPAGQSGDAVWISNARKIGEAAGAGTGLLATYSNGAWRRLSDDTPIAA